MSKYQESLKYEINNARERLRLNVIIELELKLIPFFNKYDRVEVIEFSSDSRGDDEGHNWIQFDFHIIVDGKRLYAGDYYHEDDNGDYKKDIRVDDVIYDIPLDPYNLIDMFGTTGVTLERPLV